MAVLVAEAVAIEVVACDAEEAVTEWSLQPNQLGVRHVVVRKQRIGR